MKSFSLILGLLFMTSVSAQEIQMSETASLEQIYGEVQEAQELLPMNELGIEVAGMDNRREKNNRPTNVCR